MVVLLHATYQGIANQITVFSILCLPAPISVSHLSTVYILNVILFLLYLPLKIHKLNSFYHFLPLENPIIHLNGTSFSSNRLT